MKKQTPSPPFLFSRVLIKMQSKKYTTKRTRWRESFNLCNNRTRLEQLWYTGMLHSSTRIIETAWVIMLLFPWLRDVEESNSCSTVRWLHSIVSNEDHLCASTRFNRLELELTTLSEARCTRACHNACNKTLQQDHLLNLL